MRKGRIIGLIFLALGIAYLGRIAWVNFRFHDTYQEKQIDLGETFEDSGLQITVTEAERVEKTEDSFLVCCRLQIENKTSRDVNYSLGSVNLCGEWFSYYFDDMLAREWNEEKVRNTQNFLVQANSKMEIILPFIVQKTYFEEDTWERWEEISLYLSFIQTAERKKVYIP